MKTTPFLLGSGRAGQALRKAIAIVRIQYPQFEIAECRLLERGVRLEGVPDGVENPILLIATPPGLHSQQLLEGDRAGFKAIVVEKPACVRLEEVSALEKIKTPVAVCHVYRQMWGIQTLISMIASGELGDIISVEGRYWQSSTAQRALASEKTPTWKNDPALSGPYDALIDIGTHWVDAAIHLMGEVPSAGLVWLSYANAEAPHRDSHVHLSLDFSNNRRALSSISKTMHGATNQFEIQVIGTLKSASWNFLDPDQIWIGQGAQRTNLVRKSTELGSQQPAFHSLGWIEGYIEIIHQLLNELSGKTPVAHYPTLKESLAMLKFLFSLRTHSIGA